MYSILTALERIESKIDQPMYRSPRHASFLTDEEMLFVPEAKDSVSHSRMKQQIKDHIHTLWQQKQSEMEEEH